MTEENFMLGMASLFTLFGKISDDSLKLYRNILRKISDEQFGSMVENLIMTFKPTSQVPFPLPAHFTESVGLSGEKRAIAAINAVTNAAERLGGWYSVDFGDPALHEAINHFGGWPEVCSWGNKGQWQYNERKFIEAYLAILANGGGCGPVAGNFEIGNLDKSTAGWDEAKKIAYKNMMTPKKIEWVGADFSKRIESKREEPKQIRGGEPSKISEVSI